MKTTVKVFSVLILLACSTQAHETGADVLRSLREIDNAVGLRQTGSNQVLLVSFVMKVKTRWKPTDSQGAEIRYCDAAVDKDFCAIKMKIEYEHPPVFYSIGTHHYTAGDYDNDGRLIVFCSSEKYYIYNSKKNQVRDETYSLRVNPDGNVVRTSPFTMIYKYAIGNAQSVYLIEQLSLATGRGFARFLNDLTPAKEQNPSGKLLKMEGSGHFGEPSPGKWQIESEVGTRSSCANGSIFNEWERHLGSSTFVMGNNCRRHRKGSDD